MRPFSLFTTDLKEGVNNVGSQCAHIHFLLVPYLENPPKCKLVHETDITKIKQFDWFISLLFISKYGMYEFEYFHTFDKRKDMGVTRFNPCRFQVS